MAGYAELKAKLPPNRREEIKRAAKDENITRIPNIIRIVVVRVEPRFIVITLNVENVEIAVRTSKMSSLATTPQLLVGAVFYLGHHKSKNTLHQVSLFIVKTQNRL